MELSTSTSEAQFSLNCTTHSYECSRKIMKPTCLQKCHQSLTQTEYTKEWLLKEVWGIRNGEEQKGTWDLLLRIMNTLLCLEIEIPYLKKKLLLKET